MSAHFKIQNALLSDDLKILVKELNTLNDVNLKWGSGISVIHYYITKAASLSFEPEEVIKMMAAVGVDINSQNSEGATPLHFCVASLQPNVAKVLISNNALVDKKDANGNTPLWRAVMNYRGEESLLATIKILLNAGANPDEVNNSGNSPRMMVLRRHENLSKTGQPLEWDLQPLLNW